MSQPFSETYLGQLRSLVGSQLLLVPGFRIVIEDEGGRVLLIRRSDNGKWGLPAGSPELHESMENCIHREVLEETGLTLQSFSAFGYASDPVREVNTYPNGDKTHAFVLLIYATEFEGTAKVSDDETTEVRFFEMDELPDLASNQSHELKSIQAYVEHKSTRAFQWS